MKMRYFQFVKYNFAHLVKGVLEFQKTGFLRCPGTRNSNERTREQFLPTMSAFLLLIAGVGSYSSQGSTWGHRKVTNASRKISRDKTESRQDN